MSKRKVQNFNFLKRDNVSFPPFEYNPWNSDQKVKLGETETKTTHQIVDFALR